VIACELDYCCRWGIAIDGLETEPHGHVHAYTACSMQAMEQRRGIDASGHGGASVPTYADKARQMASGWLICSMKSGLRDPHCPLAEKEHVLEQITAFERFDCEGHVAEYAGYGARLVNVVDCTATFTGGAGRKTSCLKGPRNPLLDSTTELSYVNLSNPVFGVVPASVPGSATLDRPRIGVARATTPAWGEGALSTELEGSRQRSPL